MTVCGNIAKNCTRPRAPRPARPRETAHAAGEQHGDQLSMRELLAVLNGSPDDGPVGTSTERGYMLQEVSIEESERAIESKQDSEQAIKSRPRTKIFTRAKDYEAFCVRRPLSKQEHYFGRAPRKGRSGRHFGRCAMSRGERAYVFKRPKAKCRRRLGRFALGWLRWFIEELPPPAEIMLNMPRPAQIKGRVALDGSRQTESQQLENRHSEMRQHETRQHETRHSEIRQVENRHFEKYSIVRCHLRGQLLLVLRLALPLQLLLLLPFLLLPCIHAFAVVCAFGEARSARP